MRRGANPRSTDGRFLPVDIIDRFESYIDRTSTCWLWTGTIDRNGYGQFAIDGTKHLPHRIAYELFVGAIPDGLTIDHVKARGCGNRHCVNPDHLEAVTQGENNRRAMRPTCPNGHSFTAANTVYATKRGSTYRICRDCKLEAQRRWRQRSAS